jgi:hypothetical protein
LVSGQEFLQNSLLLDAVLALVFAVIMGWLAWVWEHKPKATDNPKDPYIDDYMIRKVETFNCELNWGTRLYPFKDLTLKAISVLSDFVIRYSPPGGTELDLGTDNLDVKVEGRLTKQIRLKHKKFFKSQRITHVVLVVFTPIERDQYASNVRTETRGNTVRVWNDNHEELRNFRLILPRPVKLNRLSLTKGSINSFDIEVPYSVYRHVKGKEIGEVENDVSLSLIIDLPPKRTDGQEQFSLRIT